ncbi:hypothetical protein DBR42_03935 [Pelomonas sp. HMWF004]|nr:hypothetical protein DBR42_03935 [Pelomonas sp. HMWF004]
MQIQLLDLTLWTAWPPATSWSASVSGVAGSPGRFSRISHLNGAPPSPHGPMSALAQRLRSIRPMQGKNPGSDATQLAAVFA